MIPEIAPYNNYTGDGSTTQFDFDFYIENSSQLIVQKTLSDGSVVTLVNDADYTIHEIGKEDGSYIIFPIAGSSYAKLANDEIISLTLSLPIAQESEYGTSSELDLISLEYSLDYLTRICQILNRTLERAVKVQEGSNIETDELSRDLIIVAQNIDAVTYTGNDLARGDNSEIKKVNQNKTNIDLVVGSLSNVNAVGNNLRTQGGSIDTVYDDIKTGGTGYVKTVADDLNSNGSKVKTVAQNIVAVAYTGNDLARGDNSKIKKVADDLFEGDDSEIKKVADDLFKGDNSEIKKVNQNKTNIDLVAGSLSNVNAVGNNLRTQGGSIDTVYDDIKTGGTGYVKTVADDLNSNGSKVKTVAQNIDAVTYTGNDLARGDDSEIKKVNQNKTNIDLVVGSLSNVNAVGNNLRTQGGSIDTVYDDIKTGGTGYVKTVADDLNSNGSKVKTVAQNIVAVAYTGNDLARGDDSEIKIVADDLSLDDDSEIKKVNANKTNINTLANSMTDINDVARDILKVNAVALNLDNIDIVAGESSNIHNLAGVFSYIDGGNSKNNDTDIIDGGSSASDLSDNINGGTSEEFYTITLDYIKDLSAIRNIDKRVNLQNADIQDIDSDVENLKGDISDIQEDITSIQDNVSDIQGNITNIEDDILDIQEDIARLDELETLKGYFEYVEGGSSGTLIFENSIDGGSSASDLSDTIDGGYSKDINIITNDYLKDLREFENVSKRLNAVENAINNLTLILTGLIERLSSLETCIDGGTSI